MVGSSKQPAFFLENATRTPRTHAPATLIKGLLPHISIPRDVSDPDIVVSSPVLPDFAFFSFFVVHLP